MLEFSESKLKQFNEAGFVYDLSLFLPFERNWNMKIKFSYLIGLLALPYIFQSCDSEVDVLAPFEDVPVVYGLLDEDSTRHYIKINRLYQTSLDANDAASDRDSQEYQNLSGVVNEVNSNGDVINQFQLQSTEDVPKDSGLFFYPNQTLYYFDANLSNSNTYQLSFVNSEGEEITSTSNLVGKVNYPIDGWESPAYQISMVNSTPLINDNMRIEVVGGDNAATFDMTFNFMYRDRYYDDSFSEIKVVSVPLGRYDFGSSQVYNISYNSAVFLNTLINEIPNIDETPDVKVRVPLDTCINVGLSFANDDLMYYMMVNEPSNSLSEERPEYSNINNGLGLFASRTFWTFDYRLNSYTHQFIAGEMNVSLMDDPVTADLYNRLVPKGFCDNRGNPTGCN